MDALTLGWVEDWERQNYRRGRSSEVKNPDLWEELVALCRTHTVRYVWVKGHNGHEYNERCDRLATAYADSFAESVEHGGN